MSIKDLNSTLIQFDLINSHIYISMQLDQNIHYFQVHSVCLAEITHIV